MKGDYIEVVTAVGTTTQTTRITASKAGRTVTAKYGTKWLEVFESARPTKANPKGRSVGNSIKVRIDAIVSVEERRTDEPEPIRVSVVAPGLFEGIR